MEMRRRCYGDKCIFYNITYKKLYTKIKINLTRGVVDHSKLLMLLLVLVLECIMTRVRWNEMLFTLKSVL